MTETKALQYKPDLSPQNPNSWENGFNKCLGVKRLQVFHAFTNPNKLHWDSKFIHNANHTATTRSAIKLCQDESCDSYNIIELPCLL